MRVRRNKILILILFAALLIAAKPAVPPGLADLPHADLVSQALQEREQPRALNTQRRTFSTASTQTQAVIVTLKDPDDIPQLAKDAQRMRAHERKELKNTMREFAIHENDKRPEHKYATTNAYALELPVDKIAELRNNPLVATVVEDQQVRAMLSQSVPLINASQAWKLRVDEQNLTGAGTSVCVIDTGIDYTHPSLGACNTTQFLAGNCQKVPAGIDYVNNDDDPRDDHGHGTHVSGIAAANGSVQGVAKGARIISVKALGASGSGSFSDVGAGIEWCVNNSQTYNISAITMSLGTSCADDPGTGTCYKNYCDNQSSLTPFIDNATAQGIPVVVAAGNDNNYTHISNPACVQNSIPVASSTKADAVSSFSNRNALVDLIAPGSSIDSTCNGGGTCTNGGTSMAAPHVSGALAILTQHLRLMSKSFTPSSLVTELASTGVDIYDSSSNRNYSRIDVLAALDTLPPATSADYPQGWQNQSFNVTLNATDVSGVAYTSYSLDGANLTNGTSISVTTSANHTLVFYSVDSIGNQEPNKTIHALLDLDAPNTTDDAPASWQQAATITLTATDALSGVAQTTYQLGAANWTNASNLTLNTTGNYTLAYYSTDAAGNQEPTKNTSVLIDATTPNLTLSTPAGWQNESFGINATATDAHSGINRTRYRIDNGSWVVNDTLNITADGNYSLLFETADRANNTNSTTLHALLDTQAPTTTNDAPAAWQSKNVTITLNATDNLSGVQTTTYRVDGANWTNATTLALASDANHTIDYYSTDAAGNQEATRTASVLIDTAAPALNPTAPSGWQNQSFAVSFSPADALSGILSATISQNGTTYNSTNLTISTDGNHSLTLRASDAANNTNSTTINALLDTQAPTTTDDAPSGWQSSTVTLSLTATDAHSGVNNTRVRVDNGTWQNATQVLLSDGNHSVQYYSTDAVANQEQTRNTTVLIDTQDPQISNYTRNNTEPGVNQTVLFSADITDNTSISAQLSVDGSTLVLADNNGTWQTSINFQESGTYDAVLTASDAAGNQQQRTMPFTVYQKQELTNTTLNDTTIDSRNQTRTKLRVRTNTTVQANLTLLQSTQQPAGVNKSLDRALTHTTVKLSQNAKDALDWALLTLTYEDDELGDTNESTLRLSYYNASANEWVDLDASLDFVSATGRDTDTNEVWANVTHFSTYGLTGDENQQSTTDEESTSSSGGSSGGGGGGGGGAAPAPTTTSNSTTLSYTFLTGGSAATKHISNPQLLLTKLTLVPASDVLSASVNISKHPIPDDAPAHTTHYFEIAHPGLAVTNATLTFALDASGNVSLHRYDETWKQLPTTALGDKEYQATSPGLSRFAITDTPDSQPRVTTQTEQPNSSTQNTSTNAPQEPSSEQPEIVEQDQQTPSKDPVRILLYVLGVLALLVFVAVILEKTWHKHED